MRVKDQTKLQTQLRFEHHFYIPSYFKLNRLATNLMCTRKWSLPSCPKTHLVKQGSFTNTRNPHYATLLKKLCHTWKTTARRLHIQGIQMFLLSILALESLTIWCRLDVQSYPEVVDLVPFIGDQRILQLMLSTDRRQLKSQLAVGAVGRPMLGFYASEGRMNTWTFFFNSFGRPMRPECCVRRAATFVGRPIHRCWASEPN